VVQIKSILALAWISVITGCAAVAPSEGPAPFTPIRFLLTFDDGPSAASENNSTEKIASTLASNPTQAGIKAVFFVQTRYPLAGASPVGQRVMKQLAMEGHVLALHSGTARGHINHRTMDNEELATSLNDGIADIQTISGEFSGLVRPPFWAFDARTQTAYERAGISMLLTDLRARDGFHWMFQASPDTGGKMCDDLAYFRQRVEEGKVPTVNGVLPVVVTFHDLNHYTAAHMASYLAILVQSARDAGFRVADPPFYTDHSALLQAAHARANNNATRTTLTP